MGLREGVRDTAGNLHAEGSPRDGVLEVAGASCLLQTGDERGPTLTERDFGRLIGGDGGAGSARPEQARDDGEDLYDLS